MLNLLRVFCFEGRRVRQSGLSTQAVSHLGGLPSGLWVLHNNHRRERFYVHTEMGTAPSVTVLIWG